MLALAEVDKQERVKDYCEKLSFPFQEGTMAFDALDRGEVCGCCIFCFEKNELHIKGLFSQDIFGTSLYDGLLRAVMNYASAKGIEIMVLDESIGENILHEIEPLHFTKNTPIHIEDFFKTFRNCKK